MSAIQPLRERRDRFATTAASLAVCAGANAEAVQRMLGHANGACSLTSWIRVADSLAAAIGSAADPPPTGSAG